jgi:hypothetical protein
MSKPAHESMRASGKLCTTKTHLARLDRANKSKHDWYGKKEKDKKQRSEWDKISYWTCVNGQWRFCNPRTSQFESDRMRSDCDAAEIRTVTMRGPKESSLISECIRLGIAVERKPTMLQVMRANQEIERVSHSSLPLDTIAGFAS